MKNKILIIPALIFCAFLLIPLPAIIVTVLFAAAIISSIIILITVLVKKEIWKTLPSIVLCESLFVFAIAIASTRIILTAKTIDDQNQLLNLIHINYIAAFVLSIVMIIVTLLFTSKGAVRVVGVAARNALDSMSPKMINIDNKLNSKQITEEEARKNKRQIRMELDYYLAMDGATKFLSGIAKGISFVYLAGIIGGSLIGVFQNGQTIQDSISLYSSVCFFNLLFCMIPVFIIGLSTGIGIRSQSAYYTEYFANKTAVK